jgi:tRNA-binding EMAP/Myf-like protein
MKIYVLIPVVVAIAMSLEINQHPNSKKLASFKVVHGPDDPKGQSKYFFI